MFGTMEVARMLGVNYSKIYYWEAKGKFPRPKKIGQQKIYTQEDVDRMRQAFAQERQGEK